MEAVNASQKKHICHKDGLRCLETSLGKNQTDMANLQCDIEKHRAEAAEHTEADESDSEMQLTTTELEAGWVAGVQILGNGATGKASLWVRQHSDGRVVDVSRPLEGLAASTAVVNKHIADRCQGF